MTNEQRQQVQDEIDALSTTDMKTTLTCIKELFNIDNMRDEQKEAYEMLKSALQGRS